MAKLKECCFLLTDGNWIESKDQSLEGIRLIQTGNVGNGIYLEKEERGKYISEETFNKLKCTEIFPGDILVSRLPDPVGRACLIPEKHERMITAVDCSILRVDERIINKRYLLHFLKSSTYFNQLTGKLAGTTRVRISRRNLEQVEVNIPSSDKQAYVVSVIDEIEQIISQREQQLNVLDNLVKSRFVEMFGTLDDPSKDFKYETLKNLCNKITDGKHGGCISEVGTNRFFVGAREIFDDKVNYDTAPEINVDEFEKDYKRCNIEKGDFLIVNTGATIGKSAIAADDKTEHTLLQKSVALLKVKPKVLNPVFLKYCYKVNEGMYKVESASAQPNLLLSKISETKIYVPELMWQIQFADFVQQVDKSKLAVQKSLKETQILFDSLMQEYFD